MADQIALTKLAKARTELLIDEPFFGTLSMRLTLIEDKTRPTLAVDGKNLYYNPDFVRSQTSELMISIMAHEVMHCVLDHCGPSGRGLSLDPRKWNWAADYAVNEILKKAGFKLGDTWLYNPAFAGMTAEHIYGLIPDPPEVLSNGQAGPVDEVQPGDPDPSMAANERVNWQVATAQAVNAARAVGKLPKHLKEFIDGLQKPKIDWRVELRQFITRIAKGDYSWTRPNRKMLAAGFILPGLHSEEIGNIIIASDESGSVDKAVMQAFAAEITAIKEDLRPEKITLMHFDTEVGKVEEFTADDPFEMVRYCQGGTDFRPAIALAEKLDTPPTCMIYLTDLYGPFPKHPPGFPVLWVTINKQVAPFGETLHIEV